MSNNNKKTMPWEDSSGNQLPDELLMKVSKSWPPEIWEQYLETIEIPQRESHLYNYDKILLKKDAQNQASEYLVPENQANPLYASRQNVKKAILTLTFRQRELIREVFYYGKTIREAALKLKISEQAAIRMHARALDRLKCELNYVIKAKKDRLAFLRADPDIFSVD